MTGLRTFPTLVFGDAADAAFLRTCGKPIAAAQRMSPDQSFAGDVPAGTETALSLHAA